MHVKLSELPATIVQALNNLNYFKADIEVIVKDAMRPDHCAFEGNRAQFCVVDIATGFSKTETGSWGGSNPFEHKPLDHANELFTIPPNCVVISGENGGRGCFLRLYLRTDNVIPALNAAPVELTRGEAKVLYAHQALKSSARKGAYDPAELPAMVERGFIKQTKVGTSITTTGKNALESYRAANGIGRFSSI
jgi:hypothetical protein